MKDEINNLDKGGCRSWYIPIAQNVIWCLRRQLSFTCCCNSPVATGPSWHWATRPAPGTARQTRRPTRSPPCSGGCRRRVEGRSGRPPTTGWRRWAPGMTGGRREWAHAASLTSLASSPHLAVQVRLVQWSCWEACRADRPRASRTAGHQATCGSSWLAAAVPSCRLKHLVNCGPSSRRHRR